MQETDKYVTRKQAANILKMSEASLHLLRQQGLITPVESGSVLRKPRVMYRESDVLKLREALLSQRQPASASA